MLLAAGARKQHVLCLKTLKTCHFVVVKFKRIHVFVNLQNVENTHSA